MYMKANIWHRIYTILSLVIPVIVLFISVIDPGINGYERAMFPDMIYGTAHKPFVYRVLLPSMVRLIQSPLPIHTRIAINENLSNTPLFSMAINQLGWERNFLLDYTIAIIILYFFLYGLIGAIKYLFNELVSSPFHISEIASLLMVAFLPVMFKYYTYIYDFPNLFLFTLAMGLMASQQWNLFLLVFTLATFNKETSILLTMIFYVHYSKNSLDRKIFIKHLIIQLFLFAAIKFILTYLYINNPGSFVEFHLYDYNLILLRKIRIIPSLIIWIPVVFLIFYKWNEKPTLLRDALWILVPLICLTALFGFIDELRDYYEAYPIVSILVVYSLGKLVGFDLKSNTS